jgi:hypothetical protein
MSSTISTPDIREMLWRMISSYQEHGGRKVAELLHTEYQNIQRWTLQGVKPEPHWRNRIIALYENWKEPTAFQESPPWDDDDAKPGLLPSSGELQGAIELTLKTIQGEDYKVYGVAEFGKFSETAFVPRAHIERIKAAGGDIGSRFMGRIEPSQRERGSFRWEVTATDILN